MRLIVAVLIVASVTWIAQRAAFPAASFSVADGFAAYQPGGGRTVPTPVQFNVLTLASGGTASVGSLLIESQPKSGQIGANTTTGVITYTPTASTSGTQSVNFTLCASDAASCRSATLSFGAAKAINNAYLVPQLGGYDNQVTYIAADAPVAVSPGDTFSEEFAPAATKVPTSQIAGSYSATINYDYGFAYIIPVPPNASYVDGSAQAVGGDSLTSGHGIASECSGFGGTSTCTATSVSTDFPAATTVPYLEINLPVSLEIPPGTSFTLPTLVVQFTANGAVGSSITPQLAEFDTGADVTIASLKYHTQNVLSEYPVSPSFESVPPNGDAPSGAPSTLSNTVIGTAGSGSTQINGDTWTDTTPCGEPTFVVAPPGAVWMTVEVTGGAGGRGGNGEGDSLGTNRGGVIGNAGSLSAGISIGVGQLITATTGCAGASAPYGDGVVGAGGSGGAGWSNGGDGGDGAFCWALILGGKCLALPISYGVNGSGGGGGGSSAVCLGHCATADPPVAVAGGGGGGGESLCSVASVYGGTGGAGGGAYLSPDLTGGTGPSGSSGSEGGSSGAAGGTGGVNASAGSSFGGAGGIGVASSFSDSAGSGGGGAGFVGGTGGATGGFDCGAGGGGGGGSSWTSGVLGATSDDGTGDGAISIVFSDSPLKVNTPPDVGPGGYPFTGATWTDPAGCGIAVTADAPASATAVTATVRGAAGGIGGEGAGTGNAGGSGPGGTLVDQEPIDGSAAVTVISGCAGTSAPQSSGVAGTNGAGGTGWSSGGSGGHGHYCIGADGFLGCAGIGGPDGSGGGGGGSSAGVSRHLMLVRHRGVIDTRRCGRRWRRGWTDQLLVGGFGRWRRRCRREWRVEHRQRLRRDRTKWIERQKWQWVRRGCGRGERQARVGGWHRWRRRGCQRFGRRYPRRWRRWRRIRRRYRGQWWRLRLRVRRWGRRRVDLGQIRTGVDFGRHDGRRIGLIGLHHSRPRADFHQPRRRPSQWRHRRHSHRR